jgi:hypothetical protein
MLKCWDFNSIPGGMYNSYLRLFVVYFMLKWRLHAEYYSFKKILPYHDNDFMLTYNGSILAFY